MLDGQKLVELHEPEPGRLPLGEHLLRRHAVLLADVQGRQPLEPVLDQRDPARRLQRLAHLRQRRLRLLELVVHVDEEDPVEGRGRELRVVDLAENRHDVPDARLLHVGLQQGEHLGLDVDGVHHAGRADRASQAAREVAGSGAEVRDRVALLQGHGPDDLVGPLFFVAPRPLEPVGAARAHDGSGASLVAVAARREGQRGRAEEEENREDEYPAHRAEPSGMRVVPRHRPR